MVVYELELLIAYSRRLRYVNFECNLLQNVTRSVRVLTVHRLQRLLRLMKLMRWQEDPAFTYLSYLSLWGTLFAMTMENGRINFGKDLATMTVALGELEASRSRAPLAQRLTRDDDCGARRIGRASFVGGICVRAP